MRSINSRPETNAFTSIPRERTSRLMARQTDSSSSTMAISGLDLLNGNVLRKCGLSVRCYGITLEEIEGVCILDFGPIYMRRSADQVSGFGFQERISDP